MDDHQLDLVGSMIELFFKKTAILITNSKKEEFALGEDKDVFSTLHDFTSSEENNSLRPWSNINHNNIDQLPPLVMETYLDLRNLDNNQTLYLRNMKDNNNWAVCKGGKKNEIVLERWLLELDTQTVAQGDQESVRDDEDLSSFFHNKLLLLLRYLYTLISLLPSNDIYSSLVKISHSNHISTPDSQLRVSTRIIDGSKPILSKGRIGLSKPIIASIDSTTTHLEQKRVPPISTSMGLLRVNVSYRKNTDFYIVEDSNQYSKMSTTKPLKADGITSSYNNNVISITSISPHNFSGSPMSTNFMGLNDQNLSSSVVSRRSSSHTRSSLQPFKVGSVGSGSSTIPLARNPSNSSVMATLRAQRSSNGSINIPNNSTTGTQPIATSLNSFNVNGAHNNYSVSDVASRNSVETRFSSSFGKVRRHSSVRKSDESIKGFRSRTGSMDPQQLPPSLLNTNPSMAEKSMSVEEFPQNYNDDEIVDFMKMLDEKKDLNLVDGNYSRTSNDHVQSSKIEDNISDSLIKYKMMKLGNDNFTDSLSMSVSLTHPKDDYISSMSDNPPFGFSPHQGYGMGSLRASFDKNRRSNGSSRIGHSSNEELLGRVYSHSPQDRRGSNGSLPPGSHHLLNSDVLRSSSPTYSINRFGSSLSKISNQPSTEKFMGPTTASAAAYGNFHNPKDNTFPPSGKFKQNSSTMDDDDLLFFMSDMNKNE